MNTQVRDARSGVANENIQEILDASASAGAAMIAGQAQYQTPAWLAAASAQLLPTSHYDHVLDPQGAAGHLVNQVNADYRLVADIDNRFKAEHERESSIHRITGNCVRIGEIMTDIYGTALKFECIVANPPFGIRWKMGEESIDSTAWTWDFILARLASRGAGYLIANINTLRRLNITTHPWVYLVQEFPAGGIWENCNVPLGIVHFFNSSFAHNRHEQVWAHVPDRDEILRTLGPKLKFRTLSRPYTSDVLGQWNIITKAVAEERGNKPKFNIYLSKDGMLRTYLSTVSSHKMKREHVTRLARISNCHPLTLTTEKETRALLQEFLTSGIYTIEPAAKQAILDAILDVSSQSCPITPVTDFELVAYADEEEALKCKAKHDGNIALTPGRTYDIRTGTYGFKDCYSRKKLFYSEEDKKTELVDHQCELTGQDRFVEITDDNGATHRFMDRPSDVPWYHPEAILWELFERPVVNTVAETLKDTYLTNLNKLRTHAMLSGFSYFDGQLDYYARVGCKPYALVGADVGTGKTLGALSLIAMRSPRRALIIAPQGTMRSSGEEGEVDYQASQWVQEIRRFAPGEPVFQMFSVADYRAILHANGGEFPPGIYITYPQAYWQNNAFESLPPSWEPKEEEHLRKRLGIPFPDDTPSDDYISPGVGQDKNGIRCVVHPSLATVLGAEQPEWDMVIIDEAHLCCNLDARITQNLLRLQPRFRYAMTATPIPNYVFNLFSLMGWLCVKDWYKGGMRNAAWPYAVDEIHRFKTTFMSTETDITAQTKARLAGDKKWARKGVKESPIISSPARLLKILKPSMAYISKESCNPTLMPCEVIDVRVPCGVQQAKLYAKWLDRGNYYPQYKNPLTIAMVQLQRLRGICASPFSVEYNGGICKSDFNPKTIAILELIRDCMRRGEQVVVVSARVEQSNALAARLRDAGVPIARIDSTVDAQHHTAEANRFKRGDARVMLMGIKCAQGHSFDMCPNLIIGSLEWSYGSLHQAKGRVWRLTSRRPVKVWCVLHKNTIEELLFDRVAMKQDAATICLRGMRVPRDFMPMDASEVLAEHIVDYSGAGDTKSELECESVWPALRSQLVLRTAA